MATTPDFLKPLNSFKTEEDQTTPPTQAVPDFLQPLRREPVAAPSSLEEFVTPDQAPQAAGDRFPDSPSMTAPTGRLLPMEGGQGRPPALDPDPNFPDSPSMTAPTGPLQPFEGPNLAMYEGMNREEALALYNSYRTHPRAKNTMRGVSIDGVLVPFPEPRIRDMLPFSNDGMFAGSSGPSILQIAELGVGNTVRNIGQTVGAGIDLARNKLFGEEGEKTEPGAVSRFFGDMPVAKAVDGTLDAFLLEGAQFATGFIGGAKGMDKVVPLITNSKAFTTLAKYITGEAGGASAVDQDVGLAFLGQNAFFKKPGEVLPLMRGATFSEDAPEYEKLLKKRLNIFTEGLALGQTIEKGAKAAAWAASATWAISVAPLINAFSKGSKEERFVDDILNQLALIGSKDDAASLEAKKAIVDLIRNNEDTIIKIGEDFGPDIKITLDTMSALDQAIKSNDTALAEQLARQYSAKISSLRSGVLNQAGGAPALSERVGAPNRAFQDATNRVETVQGGSQGIDDARSGLVDLGQGEIDQAQRLVADTDLRLGQAQQDIGTIIREDRVLGAKLDQLSNTSGINIYSGRNQASDEIVANVRKAFEVMDAKKNDLYSQIQGGEVDPQGLLSILNTLRPGQLDAASGALPANSQFGDLLNAARRQTVQEPDAAGSMVVRQETDEELLERFSGYMGQNNLDFSTLYRDIRPTVSQTSENLFSSSSPEGQAAARVLREFNSYIDGKAVDDLIEAGDGEVADAAKAAKEYYMRDYVPFWRDGVLKDVADTYSNTVGRTSQGMRDQGLEFMPINFQRMTRQTVEGNLNDRNKDSAAQIIKLLSLPEGGRNPGLVTDFILGDIIGDIGVQLRSGANLSDINVNQIVGRLSEYGTVVSENFPEQAARVGQFIDNVRNARGNIESLRAQVDEAMQMAKQAEDAIYSGELGRFFNAQGIPNPNGYAVMEQIFTNPQSKDTLTALLQRADRSGDPVIRKGMQAAYARFLGSSRGFLGTVEEVSGNRALNAGRVTQENDGVKNMLEYGDQIFSDRPELMEAVRTLLDVSGLVTRSKGAKTVATDSATATRLAAMQSSNQLITFIFGVLSRTGARVRSASNTLINRLSPDEQGQRLMDALMADKDYFVQVADRALAKQTVMDPDIRDAMFAFLVRSGIYTADDEQDYFAAAMDMELNMRGKVNEMETQMQDAFVPRN